MGRRTGVPIDMQEYRTKHTQEASPGVYIGRCWVDFLGISERAQESKTTVIAFWQSAIFDNTNIVTHT